MQSEGQSPATQALLESPNLAELSKALKQPEANPLRMQAAIVGEKASAHLAAIAQRDSAREKLNQLKAAMPRLSSELNILSSELRHARANDVSGLIDLALSGSKLAVSPSPKIAEIERRKELVSDAMKRLAGVVIPDAEMDLDASDIDCLRTESESLSSWATFRAVVVAVRMGDAVSFDGGIKVDVGPETAQLTHRAGDLYGQWIRAKKDLDERRLKRQNEMERI